MTIASGNGRKEPRFESFGFPAWREAPMTSERQSEIEFVARAYAARNPSDPFAYGRIFLHMKRGIANPAEVSAEARGVPL